jgi:hypothetical protein
VLRGDYVLGRASKRLFRGRIRKILSSVAGRLKQANMKPAKKQKPINRPFRKKLEEYYADSNRRVGEMFDVDVKHWNEK